VSRHRAIEIARIAPAQERFGRVAMGAKRDRPDGDDEVGYGRPPKKSRWRKGQCGNPKRKRRVPPPLDAEIIERLFRRSFNVVEGGKTVRKTGFEIIYMQLLIKESAGDRRAAKVRDGYSRFATALRQSQGILLSYPQNDYTRQTSADWKQDRAKEEPKGERPVAPVSADESAAHGVTNSSEVER
jgi:Family of unknown function (DUF5681)